MKLVLITAVKEFEKDIKSLLKEANIKLFSYNGIIGYEDITTKSVESNWFASEFNENESVLFYAFVEKNKTDDLFNKVENFNKNQQSASKIHVVILNVEKSN